MNSQDVVKNGSFQDVVNGAKVDFGLVVLPNYLKITTPVFGHPSHICASELLPIFSFRFDIVRTFGLEVFV